MENADDRSLADRWLAGSDACLVVTPGLNFSRTTSSARRIGAAGSALDLVTLLCRSEAGLAEITGAALGAA